MLFKLAFSHFSLHFAVLAYKGEWGKVKQGKGELKEAKASGVRARGAMASEARASETNLRGEGKRRVTSKDSLFHHHHHSNFDDFLLRAIAPFTGIIINTLFGD